MFSLPVAGNKSPQLFLGHPCFGFILTKMQTHCIWLQFQRFQSIMARRVWKAAHIMVAREQRKKMPVLTGFFFSSFYSIRVLSLWDGTAHIERRSSSS
jgi:hypothetical protein